MSMTQDEFDELKPNIQERVMLSEADRIYEKGNKDFYSGKEKDVPTIPYSYQVKMEGLLEKINNILLPTYNKLAHNSTKSEIQERLYLKILPNLNILNECLYNSRDISDSYNCSDKFVNYLENDVIDYAKSMISEY